MPDEPSPGGSQVERTGERSSPAARHVDRDVSTAAALDAAREALLRAPEIAIDVETNSMYAYRARLCFVQLATATEIYVVDTLAEGVSARGLAEPLGARSIRKVFHDAQGDLRELARAGVAVEGIFDTHRAATMLGLPKVGLGGLVEERFGVQLAKEHQTADFGLRPLPPELRAYVADDVRYLLPLAGELEREARDKDVWEELELEFERIAAEAREPEPPPRSKLPPAARDAAGLAIAAAVDELRQREAEARDVPVGRVLANAALGEIALRRPRTERELARIPGVKGSFLRPVGRELLAAIERILAADARGELPPPPRPEGRRDPDRREREERLKSFRAEAAKARGVTTTVVLPAPVLERLVAAPPADLEQLAAVPWLGEKRVRLYGEAILSVLAG